MWLDVALVAGTWALAIVTIILVIKTRDTARATQTTAEATRAAAEATADAARTTYEAQLKAFEFQKLAILAEVMTRVGKDTALAAVGGTRAFIIKATELGLRETDKA